MKEECGDGKLKRFCLSRINVGQKMTCGDTSLGNIS